MSTATMTLSNAQVRRSQAQTATIYLKEAKVLLEELAA